MLRSYRPTAADRRRVTWGWVPSQAWTRSWSATEIGHPVQGPRGERVFKITDPRPRPAVGFGAAIPCGGE